MSNRNFDNSVIIQRLQDQNRSRNIYLNTIQGKRIINNPQTSDNSSNLINTYHNGSQTMYFRGLISGCITTDIGSTLPINQTSLIINNSNNIIEKYWIISNNSSQISLNVNTITTDIFGNIYTAGRFTTININNIGIISSGIIKNSTVGILGNTTTTTNSYILKYNPTGEYLWANKIGPNIENPLSDIYTNGNSITTDLLGNIYITGQFNNTNAFPLIRSFVNNISSISSGFIQVSTVAAIFGSNDVYIVKYNSSGNVLWTNSIGSSNSDNGTGITTDMFGNVYAIGTFNTSTFINNVSSISSSVIQTSTIGRLIGSGNNDTYIVKYDSSGNVLWANSIGGANSDNGTAITTDLSGNVYAIGIFNTSTFINNVSTISSSVIQTSTIGRLIGSGSNNAYIVKYDSTGNVLWTNSIGGSNSDNGTGITTDLSGNVYAIGTFNTSTFINNVSTISSGVIQTSTIGRLIGSGSNDVYIVKYDSTGNVLWANSIGGSNSDNGTGITTDMFGNVYAIGTFNTSTFINNVSTISSGVIQTSTIGRLIGSGSNNAYIVKYDSTGNVLWTNSIGGYNSFVTPKIITDINNNLCVSGNMIVSNSSSFINNVSSISSGIILTSPIARIFTDSALSYSFIVKYTPDGKVFTVSNT